MEEMILAADLGGTNLRMALVDANGRPHGRSSRPVPRSVTRDGLTDLIVAMAAETARGVRFRAAAFTAPSPIPFEFDGILTKLPNLPSVTGMNFLRALEAHFDVPVIVENDATAAAIGEAWIGASSGVATSVCMTLGTGIGGGIIFDGRAHRGPDGVGGEIGHITVEPDGVPCGCGGRGCIEQYASATAMVRLAREAGLDVAEATEVFRLWESGNAAAGKVFERVGRCLGIVLAGLANALNPDMFVIGGGASAAWDAFIPTLNSEFRARAYPAAVARAPVRRTALGDDAGIIGAARSAMLRGALSTS